MLGVMEKTPLLF